MQIGFKRNRSSEKICCQCISTEHVAFTYYLAKANIIGERLVAESDLLALLEKKKTIISKKSGYPVEGINVDNKLGDWLWFHTCSVELCPVCCLVS